MTEKKFVVHQSTIKTWRRCKRQYFYSYTLKIERRRRSSPLMRGTTVHEMIEANAIGADPWEALAKMELQYAKLLMEEKDYYGDVVGEIRTIMAGYFKWYKQDPIVPIPIKGKLTEHQFEVNLTPSILLRGKIDLVGKGKKNKRKWLVDHKSHKQLPKGDIKYSDIQSALYVDALEKTTGIAVDGVAWNYLRWKAPTVPDVLKNGTMSRRQADTTWDVYEKALIEAGLNPADYTDMKENLAGKEAEFYVRSYLPVNRTILETLVEEAQTTAREMKRKGGHDKTRTIERHCDWCDFYNLCQAELRGLDSDFILKHDYQPKKEHFDENDEETLIEQ